MLENINEAVVEYIEAESRDHIEKVRKLFIEYADSLGVDLEFQGFRLELDTLPGKYAYPSGSILLALVNGEPAGCVALRKISQNTCEMKRLYVRDDYRGLGIGKELSERIIKKARLLNYSYLRLDTLPTMTKAQAMYRKHGFYEIEPYIFNPIEGTKFLELKLQQFSHDNTTKSEGKSMNKITPEYKMENKGHYSPGIVSNGMLYISGQLSVDPDTRKVAEGGLREHAVQALANVERVLKEAGLTRENVVQCRVYITDMSHWDEFNKIYAEFFGDHKPARAVVPVGELHFGCLVEIEAIAEAKE